MQTVLIRLKTASSSRTIPSDMADRVVHLETGAHPDVKCTCRPRC